MSPLLTGQPAKRQVGALVLHIDSPGGSAGAGEILAQPTTITAGGHVEPDVGLPAQLAGLEAPRRLDLRPGPPVSRLSRMLRGLMRDAVPELRLIELWRRSCAVLCL